MPPACLDRKPVPSRFRWRDESVGNVAHASGAPCAATPVARATQLSRFLPQSKHWVPHRHFDEMDAVLVRMVIVTVSPHDCQLGPTRYVRQLSISPIRRQPNRLAVLLARVITTERGRVWTISWQWEAGRSRYIGRRVKIEIRGGTRHVPVTQAGLRLIEPRCAFGP